MHTHTENELATIIYGAALKIHRTLGPGLLESAYEECLAYELSRQNLKVEKQKLLPLAYEDMKLEAGYRIDLMIDGKFIIEIKSVDALAPLHTAQILTYLKLSNCKLGYLINFNVPMLKNGIKRIINGNLG